MPVNTRTNPHSVARRSIHPQPLEVSQIQGALLTVKNAAALAGVSVDSIYRWAQRHPDFPPLLKFGRRCTRIPSDAFKAWLATQQPNV